MNSKTHFRRPPHLMGLTGLTGLMEVAAISPNQGAQTAQHRTSRVLSVGRPKRLNQRLYRMAAPCFAVLGVGW
jgi:hypothetical protein